MTTYSRIVALYYNSDAPASLVGSDGVHHLAMNLLLEVELYDAKAILSVSTAILLRVGFLNTTLRLHEEVDRVVQGDL